METILTYYKLKEHLQKRLGDIEALPALLAAALRDLENEKLAKKTLEDNYKYLKNETDELKKSLGCEDNEKIEIMRKELEEENIQLKATIDTLNDSLEESQRRYTERSYYLLQLKEQLDVVREESAIQVTKIKNIFDCQKLKYTDCIQNLEQKLAKCKAMACVEFKKRDCIDERLRNQVETLTKSLNEAHKKISEFQDTNKLIELKIEGELCKIPFIKNSRCKDVNEHRGHAKDE